MISPKKLWFTSWASLCLIGLTHYLYADAGFAACRFVPERKDDFAFENDKVAFRIYGPALRDSKENSGIDCWLKRVDYPIIEKWYQGAAKGTSYHKDHGEGYDPYHVNDSLGCGGLALWIDGQMHLANVFQEYRILNNGPDEAVFEVKYSWENLPGKMTEIRRFTLAAGSQLFKAESQIFKNGRPIQAEVAIGVTTHNQKAQPYHDMGGHWVAAWETFDKSGLGTGVVLKNPSKARTLTITSYEEDRSHVVLITPTDKDGKVTYYGGFAWEKAGEITTPGAWRSYLSRFNP
jgi:hypothetical protein